MIGEKYKNEKNDIKYVFQIKLIQFSNFSMLMEDSLENKA